MIYNSVGDFMKVSFSKRLMAYVIDYLIVSFAFVIITMGFTSSDKYGKEALELFSSLSSGEITMEEYSSEAKDLIYREQKSEVPVNIASTVLFIGYFAVFGYLNKGQTIGKKVFKIRIREKNDDPSIKAMVIRSLLIYGILTSIYSAIFVNILNINDFNIGNSIVTYIENIVIIVSFFMIMYRKDGRGLHDILAGTNVIEEVK